MIRLLGVVFLVIICALVALFAVSNMGPLTLRLNLLLPDGFTMMASVWVLLAVAIGMILGMLFGWTAGSGGRARHRKTMAENRRLSNQVSSLAKLAAAGGTHLETAVASSTLAAPKPTQRTLEIESRQTDVDANQR